MHHYYDYLKPLFWPATAIASLNGLQAWHDLQISINLFGQLLIIVATLVYLVTKIKKLNRFDPGNKGHKDEHGNFD